ncbi:MAG: FtsX-like permease family protein [Patescibacteria group bacterium]|jgi:ABC-type lipoprotein release transport system permease subunit
MVKRLLTLRKDIAAQFTVGWFLALRQIRRSSRWTTGLIVFIMVLTYLNLVVVSGLLVGLIAGSFAQFQDKYAGQVLVTPVTGYGYIDNSSALISFLEHHPQVIALSARHTMAASVLGTLDDLPKKNKEANKVAAQVVGIDIAHEEAVTGFSESVIKGSMLQEGEEGYIVIGQNLLRHYSSFADADIPGLTLLDNVDVGDRVKVSMKTETGVTSKSFLVKGIVKSKVDQISTRMFINDNELKQMLLINQELYQEIAIRTPHAYAPSLVREIEQFQGSNETRVQTAEDAVPSFLRDVETTFNILGNALSSIALVVASITIFIVIFINAVTKRKFIGIMKGIGVAPRAIQISYILQALFYGIIGSFIGLILTFGVLKPYFAAHPIDFPFSDGILVATPESAAVRVLILLVVTLLAGMIPARMIVRKNTLDSILGR